MRLMKTMLLLLKVGKNQEGHDIYSGGLIELSDARTSPLQVGQILILARPTHLAMKSSYETNLWTDSVRQEKHLPDFHVMSYRVKIYAVIGIKPFCRCKWGHQILSPTWLAAGFRASSTISFTRRVVHLPPNKNKLPYTNEVEDSHVMYTTLILQATVMRINILHYCSTTYR